MLTTLRFSIDTGLIKRNIEGMRQSAKQMKDLARNSGTDSPSFAHAWRQTNEGLDLGRPIEDLIQDKYHVRVVGLMLTTPSEYKKLSLSQKLLDKVNTVVRTIPTIFLESVYQRFLTDFSLINDLDYVCCWLKKCRLQKGQSTQFDELLLHSSGPKQLVDFALKNQLELNDALCKVELQDYALGRFAQTAQKIYYLEQLKSIPSNKPHELLKEIAKPEVFSERYDGTSLLGHHLLEILISRAPMTAIDDSWLNVILAIAGDPRVPVGNQRYIKWWSHISEDLRKKVRGWLSGLDLKLFLAALKDFSDTAWNTDFQRMYPSRKQFLEGIYNLGLITETRLFLSRDADRFLRRSYHRDHLPLYDVIKDGDKSIIYVEMQSGCMIEGSHSCYLWVYDRFPEAISLINRGRNQSFTYGNLTSGLSLKLVRDFSIYPVDKIQHNPTNFNWQRKGVDALKRLSLPVSMRDVLTPSDYNAYKRRFGVG